MTKRTTKSDAPVATIALYGAQHCGHGFIATVGTDILTSKSVGDGEVHACWSATEAIFRACEALGKEGLREGVVAIYRDEWPSISYVAYTKLERPASFGQLEWKRAEPALTISVEEIEKVAVPVKCDGCGAVTDDLTQRPDFPGVTTGISGKLRSPWLCRGCVPAQVEA